MLNLNFSAIHLLVVRAQKASNESRALLTQSEELLIERAGLLDERIRVMREIISSSRYQCDEASRGGDCSTARLLPLRFHRDGRTL